LAGGSLSFSIACSTEKDPDGTFYFEASSFQDAVVVTGQRILKCACSDGGDSLPIAEGAGCEDA
jgi:hypothetical protein